MKREKKKLKMMALSAVLAVGMLLPMSAMAQYGKNENFFKSENGYFRSGSPSGDIINEGYGGDSNNFISNETYGVSLGSGLLIMVAAGAGYAILKRKKS